MIQQDEPRQKVTIRPTTQAERDKLAPAHPRYRYVCVNPENDHYYLTFGVLVQGGHSKAEAVFWAERLASKNGMDYIPPKGWEDIEGEL